MYLLFSSKMGKKRFWDDAISYYGIGFYFLGVSAGFLLNLLLEIPWQINLFYIIVMFTTSMILISRSKRMSRDLIKEKKNLKKNKK